MPQFSLQDGAHFFVVLMVVGGLGGYYSAEMAFDRMLRQHRREIPSGLDLESAFEKWVSLIRSVAVLPTCRLALTRADHSGPAIRSLQSVPA